MLAGVCNGIAAFVGIDATVIRIAFVILAFVTVGFWALEAPPQPALSSR